MSTEQPTGKQATADKAPVRKFMFDRSFDDASVVHRAPERKPVLMKPEQIDALKKEAYDLGFASGKTAGLDEQTARMTGVLETVERNLDVLIQSLSQITQDQVEQSRALALAAAKKIMPNFVAKHGVEEIEPLLNDTLRSMAREPRLVVRVHQSEFDVLNERAQALAEQRAYSGKLIVLADDEIAAGDCRIEWDDGGVERNAQATMNAVEQTILPSS